MYKQLLGNIMTNREKALMHLIKKARAEYSTENYVVAIPGFMSKKFIAYCSMRDNLNLILEYIEILRTPPKNPTISNSLTYSLLALYGKCFTDAAKKSYPKLEPNSLFKDLDELRQIHDYLMDLRHHFIAHRGDTDSEVGISLMAIPKVKDGQPQLNFKQVKLGAFTGKRIDEIQTILEFLKVELEKKIQKCGQKVYDGFFNFNPKEMSLMVMNEIKGKKNIKKEE